MIDVNYINEFFSWQFLGFIGIVLEIIGFGLMTFRWGIHPKHDQHMEWIENNQKFYDKWLEELPKSKYSHMYIDNIVRGDYGNDILEVKYRQVPDKFRWHWNRRTKIPSLFPVIIGLAFQGLELII